MAGETKETIRRIGRGQNLHRVIPILDASGKVIDRVVKPLMVEMRIRDVLQVVVGLPSSLSGAVSDALK